MANSKVSLSVKHIWKGGGVGGEQYHSDTGSGGRVRRVSRKGTLRNQNLRL